MAAPPRLYQNTWVGEKLDENDPNLLCAILNKSWKQYPTKQ